MKAPEGSILNCSYPASVNARVRTGWYIAPNIFRALSQAAPNQVQSFTGLPVAADIYGQDKDGNYYSDMLFLWWRPGRFPARRWPFSVVVSHLGRQHFGQTRASRAPVLLLEKTYVTDSGGAGQQRGGLGQLVRLRKRDADGIVMQVSVFPEGVSHPVTGLHGGSHGGLASGRVLDNTTHAAQELRRRAAGGTDAARADRGTGAGRCRRGYGNQHM